MRDNLWFAARISKEYSFSASHYLPNVPENHKCKRLHGHTYTVICEVRGDVSPKTGMICDYGFIDDAVKWIIDDVLDHRHLNDIDGLENPTAENLCAYIMREHTPKILFSVTVKETPKTSATVINGDGFYRAADKL